MSEHQTKNVEPAILPAHPEENVEQTFLSAHFSHSLSDLPLEQRHRRLPHWTCESVVYWITFRLADSLPQNKLKQWREERDVWLRHNPEPWNEQQWNEHNLRFGERMEQWLDAGYGSCALANPDVREVVRDCLQRFDGKRLRHHAAVIMPNHVHLLTEMLGNNKLPALMKGIKGASARRANQIVGASGQFWLDESFDHIVRSEAQYWHLVNYVQENPVKAGLSKKEYWLYLK